MNARRPFLKEETDLGFFSGIAKAVGAIAGIAAAPATGGASLALTAASVAGSTIGAIADANAQKAQSSAVKAGANAAVSQAQASVKVAELQAEQQEQDRIFQAAQLDKLLAQQEENSSMNIV